MGADQTGCAHVHRHIKHQQLGTFGYLAQDLFAIVHTMLINHPLNHGETKRHIHIADFINQLGCEAFITEPHVHVIQFDNTFGNVMVISPHFHTGDPGPAMSKAKGIESKVTAQIQNAFIFHVPICCIENHLQALIAGVGSNLRGEIAKLIKRKRVVNIGPCFELLFFDLFNELLNLVGFILVGLTQ